MTLVAAGGCALTSHSDWDFRQAPLEDFAEFSELIDDIRLADPNPGIQGEHLSHEAEIAVQIPIYDGNEVVDALATVGEGENPNKKIIGAVIDYSGNRTRCSVTAGYKPEVNGSDRVPIGPTRGTLYSLVEPSALPMHETICATIFQSIFEARERGIPLEPRTMRIRENPKP